MKCFPIVLLLLVRPGRIGIHIHIHTGGEGLHAVTIKPSINTQQEIEEMRFAIKCKDRTDLIELIAKIEEQ